MPSASNRALICSLLLSAGALAHAETAIRSYRFDIASTSLSQALRDYGQISRQQIIFTEDLVVGKSAPELKGEYTSQIALEKLLEGSGLTAERAPSGALMIRRAPQFNRTSLSEAPAKPTRIAQSPPAQAENSSAATAELITEVIVTGSLIARSNDTAPSPLSVVDSEEIMNAGAVTISEVLRRDPSLGSQSRGPQNSLNGAGSVGVSLRNLGNRRSLVLVDGKRYPMFSDNIYNAVQDIGAIPTAMIERVEVLRDGASTTYGADAVAGVVNFMLRDKFDGLQTEGFYGISDEGDGEQYRASLLAGTTFERGSLTVVAQYQKSEEIPQDSRGWATNLITSLIGPGAINSVNSPGGPIVRQNGQLVACYPIDGGTANLAPGCELYDPSQQSSLVFGMEVKSIGLTHRYDLSDDVEFNVKAFYTDRQSSQNISSTQIATASATGFYRSIPIPATNSNNPYGETVFLRWRPANYGPRTTRADANTFWANAGFSGQLFDRFDWDISHTYGETRSTQTSTNTPVSSALYNLLNPTACAANPECAAIGPVPNIAALLQQVTPLTPEQKNYLFYSPVTHNEYVSQQTLAKIGGALLPLPAGDLSAAIGLEYRSESGWQMADRVTQSADPIGSYIFPTDGSFHTKEAFAELDIPVLKNLPGARELTANLQGRYSDFSTFGGAWTYKLGLNYTPVEDVRFRASYGTSFRAPDVLELYAGGFAGNGSGQDPCNTGAGSLRNGNATVAANCLLAGAPGSYAQPTTTLPIRSGGNPGLQPEKGRTYSAGIVVTPTVLPDLSLTLDYYDVRIRDAITLGSTLLQQTLNACYSAADFVQRVANPTDICFGFEQRAANGDLLRVNTGQRNLSVLRTSGVDATLNYELGLGSLPGEIDFGLRVGYLRSFEQDGIEYVGTFLSGIAGDASYPRFRGTAQVAYGLDRYNVQWAANYVGHMRDYGLGTTVPVNNFKGYDGTPSYFSHDLRLRVSGVIGSDVLFGVNNVLDKDPPYAFVTTRNTLSTTFDQVGRYYYVTLSHKF